MTPANVSITPLLPGELVVGVEWTANQAWWGAAALPQPPVRTVITPTNLNSSAVRAGLQAGTIHVAVGAATLSPDDFIFFRTAASGGPVAAFSEPLQTRILLLNTNANALNASAPPGTSVNGPLASLAVRQAVNMALDKAALVAALRGLESAADRLFSTDTPYANTDIGARPTLNLPEARRILEDAGWAGATTRSRAGVQLAGVLTYVSTDAAASAIGELAKRARSCAKSGRGVAAWP